MSKTRLLPGSGAVFSGMPPLSCILQERREERQWKYRCRNEEKRREKSKKTTVDNRKKL